MYALMSALYFLSFYLYHLPLSYFWVSLLFNLTLLLILSIWLFIQFRKKLLVIQNFFFVQDLDDLSLPSELAYQQLIEQLIAAESEKGLVEKSRMESLQTMVKMWSHQMKVPLSALSLMAQTDQLDRQEVRQQLLRLENYLDTLLTYLKFSQHKDDFRFEALSARSLVVDMVKKYRVACLAK